jgi:hypothetical protein
VSFATADEIATMASMSTAHCWLGSFLLVALCVACDGRDGTSVTTERHLTVAAASGDAHGLTLAIGTNRNFSVGIEASGYTWGCTGYPDTNPLTGQETCSAPLSQIPWTKAQDATVVSAACEGPPDVGCSTTVTAPAGIAVAARSPGSAVVVIVARSVEDGAEVSYRLPVTFEDAKALDVSIESPQRLKDVFVPNEEFRWCARATGTSGRALPAVVMVHTSGPVELGRIDEEPAPGMGSCPILHTTQPGKGTVTLQVGTATQTFTIETVGEDAVTSLEFVVPPSPHVEVTTAASADAPSDIARWVPLRSSTIAPDEGGFCDNSFVARFTIADGRVGLAPGRSMSAQPPSLLQRFEELVEDPAELSPDATGVVYFNVVGGPGTATVSATVGTHSAEVSVDVGNCVRL